jgi:hypothetical protein
LKSVKTHAKLPFGVTKKDAGLVFHFHVSKMFKCWSKLGLANIQMSIKIQKNKKPVHIVFLCHILTAEVVKHDLYRFKQKNHVCYVMSSTLSYEVKGEERWFTSKKKRGGLGFGT